EKITYARKMLRGEMPAREDIPCTTCEIYLHMCANNRWIKRENLGSAVTLTAEGARRNGDDTRVPGAERRNGLCRCGSGKRYKHCHGRLGVTASNVNFVWGGDAALSAGASPASWSAVMNGFDMP